MKGSNAIKSALFLMNHSGLQWCRKKSDPPMAETDFEAV